jgi:predicted ATPase
MPERAGWVRYQARIQYANVGGESSVARRFPQDGFTDFVGREGELLQIAALLERSRLLTVVGPGGVGKTRVALVAASAAVDTYPDGVWITELSGLRDPGLLINTVGDVLGLPEQDARPKLDAVLDYLRDRRLLLIFDTCEHLLDSCATLIQSIVRYAPDVTILATSRQPLDTPGEHIFQIPPLPVPASDDAVLGGGDAIELFALRAAAATPDFALTAENAGDVIRLCRRLDGIPLAIELAAVQLRALPLDELTRRLGHRFTLLASRQPGAVPRHETLRTAIEWSNELCSPAERRLWARLSVFAGTFSLPAAEEVCAEVEIERSEVVNALIGLVDKSVVLREGERYRMLDTLREFGAEQLTASGEEAACRGRHIGRYLSMARYFGEHFADDDQMDRYFELRRTHSNLRAALEYALDDSGEPSAADDAVARWRSGTEMACALYGYWQISGLLSEGGYWLTKALDRFAADSRERALALVNRGFLRSFHGAIEGARVDCEAGIALARALGEDAITARGYQHLQLTLVFLGEHDEAAAAGTEARERLRACGDRAGELMLMAQLGHLHHLDGRPAEAVAVCEEGLAMLGPDSDEQWIRSYLYFVSSCALLQMPGREADCEAAVRRSLLAKEELGDIIGMAYSLEVLGWLSLRTGAPERTAWLLGAAQPLWARGGVRFSGTAIMEDHHQMAERNTRELLGPRRYDTAHATGSAYMYAQLNAVIPGSSSRLRVRLP